MKNITKIFAIALVALGFSTNVLAQASDVATATASGTIVVAITIDQVTDLNFGNILTGAIGTVTIEPDGDRTNTGVTLAAGIVSAASFTVGGFATSTYSIQLPASHTITNTTGTGAETMLINGFTSTPTPTGVIGSGGNQTLQVGATLNITSATQAAGLYTNASGFPVTVAYN